MFVVIKKQQLIAASLALVMVLAGVFGIWLATSTDVLAFGERRLVPIYYVDRSDGKVALTFDAAWGADKTLQILDILDKNDIKATFFLVGFWVDKYPDMVKEIDKRGHLIGNHSTNHLHANKLTQEELASELQITGQKIYDLTGKTPKFFRPPFGEYNNRLIEAAQSLGIATIQWDVDSLDWKDLTSRQIADRVVPKTKSGSIILFHNNSTHIVAALPLVIFGIKSKGLSPVRLDEMVYTEDYIIASDGAQRLKTE